MALAGSSHLVAAVAICEPVDGKSEGSDDVGAFGPIGTREWVYVGAVCVRVTCRDGGCCKRSGLVLSRLICARQGS